MKRHVAVRVGPVLHHLGLAGTMALSLACGSGGSSSHSTSTSASGDLTLSGTLPSTSTTTALAGLRPQAVNASTVKTVLLFGTDGSAWTSAVSNGAFSVSVDSGSPLGMVFAGSSSQFLGYLSLGSGINSLPLTILASGVSSIDLGTLSASGEILTPANNPLTGGELPLTTAEQTAFAQCNGMFAGVVQNPDVDGNGVIDLLENTFYHSWVAYWVTGGAFNGALTPTLSASVAIKCFNITLTAEGTADTTATVSGPSGSGISGQACTVSVDTANSQTGYSIYSDLGSSTTAVPVSGSYVFTTGLGKTLTITVPDQSAASSHIVIAVPTVTLTGSNTIASVSWTYQTVSGDAITTPAALISSFDLEIDQGGSRVYNAYNLAPSVTSHTIASGTTIPWDSTVRIYMAYNDVFQNHYVVPFNNY
jgi:hypothetical protein